MCPPTKQSAKLPRHSKECLQLGLNLNKFGRKRKKNKLSNTPRKKPVPDNNNKRPTFLSPQVVSWYLGSGRSEKKREIPLLIEEYKKNQNTLRRTRPGPEVSRYDGIGWLGVGREPQLNPDPSAHNPNQNKHHHTSARTVLAISSVRRIPPFCNVQALIVQHYHHANYRRDFDRWRQLSNLISGLICPTKQCSANSADLMQFNDQFSACECLQM